MKTQHYNWVNMTSLHQSKMVSECTHHMRKLVDIRNSLTKRRNIRNNVRVTFQRPLLIDRYTNH